MKVWIETYKVEPPPYTVSGRFGGSVMFVYYFRVLDQWIWIQPNSIEERIAEPQEIFVDSEWIRAHPSNRPRPESTGKIHRQREQQLILI
jgi:hypothetical protein